VRKLPGFRGKGESSRPFSSHIVKKKREGSFREKPARITTFKEELERKSDYPPRPAKGIDGNKRLIETRENGELISIPEIGSGGPRVTLRLELLQKKKTPHKHLLEGGKTMSRASLCLEERSK